VLELWFKDQQPQWDLVAKKGYTWINKQAKNIRGEHVGIDWDTLINQNLLDDVKSL